jgi:predicted adenylyl cyclase CyaB
MESNCKRAPDLWAGVSSLLEREVKLRVSHSEFLRSLESLGLNYEIISSDFQEDIYLDFDDCRLMLSDVALRIRIAGGSVSITYKGPRSIVNGEKLREEIEGFLGSDTCDSVLKVLGISLKCPSELEKVIEYLKEYGITEKLRVRKLRRELRVNGVSERVYLDVVEGLGEFVEVEGEGAIDLIRRLNMTCRIVTPSYADILHAIEH